MKILMICLGNICRSPLAEGILRKKIEEHGLDWRVESAGTGNWHIGEAPDPRSVATARRHGLDITYQRARQVRPSDLDAFDLLLAMDESNYHDVLALAQTGAQQKKVKMILDFVHPGERRSVPDPYWNDNGFEHVYQLLEEACERVVATYVEA